LVNGKSTRRRRGRSVTAASLLQQRVEDRGLEETCRRLECSTPVFNLDLRKQTTEKRAAVGSRAA
jgi:hypothetical protein